MTKSRSQVISVLINNDYVLILDNRLADRLLYILGMNYIACGSHYN